MDSKKKGRRKDAEILNLRKVKLAKLLDSIIFHMIWSDFIKLDLDQIRTDWDSDPLMIIIGTKKAVPFGHLHWCQWIKPKATVTLRYQCCPTYIFDCTWWHHSIKSNLTKYYTETFWKQTVSIFAKPYRKLN